MVDLLVYREMAGCTHGVAQKVSIDAYVTHESIGQLCAVDPVLGKERSVQAREGGN